VLWEPLSIINAGPLAAVKFAAPARAGSCVAVPAGGTLHCDGEVVGLAQGAKQVGRMRGPPWRRGKNAEVAPPLLHGLAGIRVLEPLEHVSGLVDLLVQHLRLVEEVDEGGRLHLE